MDRSNETDPIGGPIVLLVEDDPDLRSTAAAIMEGTQVNCAEAKSAEDALVYLQDHAPDVGLIFTNLDLPGRLDGIDLARIASFRWPRMKVLLTSGEVRIHDIPQNLALLPKHWHPADIRGHLSWEVARERAIARERAFLSSLRREHHGK